MNEVGVTNLTHIYLYLVKSEPPTGEIEVT